MAYNKAIAERLRAALSRCPDVTEKKMFGGIAFLMRGHMCCGVVGEELVVRTGPRGHDAALSEPYTRKMDFTGKPLRGFVYVEPAGFASDRDLEAWIAKAVEFALSLPAK